MIANETVNGSLWRIRLPSGLSLQNRENDASHFLYVNVQLLELCRRVLLRVLTKTCHELFEVDHLGMMAEIVAWR
jgi:hypothetical protein